MHSDEASALVRANLGGEGALYVRQALASGLSLSKLLLRLDIEGGEVFTFARKDADRARLLRWSEGGLHSADAGLDAATRELGTHMMSTSSLLVAENAMARPTDELMQHNSAEHFFYGEEVYEFCAGAVGLPELKRCLRRADAGYTLNAIAGIAPRAPGRAEDVKYLERLAAAPALILARAHDGEGFVMWRQRS